MRKVRIDQLLREADDLSLKDLAIMDLVLKSNDNKSLRGIRKLLGLFLAVEVVKLLITLRGI